MRYFPKVNEMPSKVSQLTPLLRLGAGAYVGIIAMSATYPMDMVRGRITVQIEKSPYQYRGMFYALSTILREEVYESLKNWMVKTKPLGLVDDSTKLGIITRMACGVVAGAVGKTISYPLDIICRRIQIVG
ncbi:Mitochondrial adenine nucleotide transporter ADNT1 [Capsicum baccatum]|uniref:Mitochondrial adenine nucleotide transporter ADNT1 n=1 Tax=Capsicum baccatum TaxID=33114 RepID=A0A2G2WXY9_CAPBA|nr:Mitochondrial adenine nucleotide transporter ADNT1 [Capsicum baccatum]